MLWPIQTISKNSGLQLDTRVSTSLFQNNKRHYIRLSFIASKFLTWFNLVEKCQPHEYDQQGKFGKYRRFVVK